MLWISSEVKATTVTLSIWILPGSNGVLVSNKEMNWYLKVVYKHQLLANILQYSMLAVANGKWISQSSTMRDPRAHLFAAALSPRNDLWLSVMCCMSIATDPNTAVEVPESTQNTHPKLSASAWGPDAPLDFRFVWLLARNNHLYRMEVAWSVNTRVLKNVG